MDELNDSDSDASYLSKDWWKALPELDRLNELIEDETKKLQRIPRGRKWLSQRTSDDQIQEIENLRLARRDYRAAFRILANADLQDYDLRRRQLGFNCWERWSRRTKYEEEIVIDLIVRPLPRVRKMGRHDRHSPPPTPALPPGPAGSARKRLVKFDFAGTQEEKVKDRSLRRYPKIKKSATSGDRRKATPASDPVSCRVRGRRDPDEEYLSLP